MVAKSKFAIYCLFVEATWDFFVLLTWTSDIGSFLRHYHMFEATWDFMSGTIHQILVSLSPNHGFLEVLFLLVPPVEEVPSFVGFLFDVRLSAL